MSNTDAKTETTGKVTVSDVTSKLIYYVEMQDGGWFDGYSKAEILQKAQYMGLKLDWKGCKSV